MKLAILKETRANETRVAGSPEVVKKLIGLGFQVVVHQDAWRDASFTDAAYRDAGQRSEFRVSYNGYTLPGDQDVVCLEWTDDTLRTPTREGHDLPKEALALGGQVRELTESQRIEFLEMLTPEKFQE